MEDYREAQRQKWLKSQSEKQNQASSASSGAADTSDSNATPAMPAQLATAPEDPSASDTATSVVAAGAGGTEDSSSAPGEKPSLRRLHFLPLGNTADESGQRRLDLVAPELRRRRSAGDFIREGQVLKSNGHIFVVVKSDPETGGVLSQETDYFEEGDPVWHFEKVQFICLWDFESRAAGGDPGVLFSEYVGPYFRSITDSGEDMGALLSQGQTLKIFDLEFQVMATDPATNDLGFVDCSTTVYVAWDETPEFDKIHIVPFQDTLPHAYDFDVFNDYLKPYLTRNKHMRFATNDQFTYQGVQFKVVCCEPHGPARIGRNTTIYCEGMLHPSLRNLLPPELLEQLSHLPPGLQMLLLNTEALAGGYEERLMEVQEMLSRRRGLSQETIGQVEMLRWDSSTETQNQCMVCLAEFVEGEEVRKLPCGHIFHAGCIDEWLRRCTDCPICKANVDRAVRQY